MRAAATLALLAALLLSACGIDARAPDVPGSTLRATVADPDGDGDLSAGPGEPLVDRTELAPRARVTRQVARFAQLSDTHVRDEESPARVPFLDRLGPPVTSTFRPQEALSPQVLAAMVRAVNAERPQGVLMTGDLIDSAQRNELDQFLRVLEGGPVEPGSGRRGYRGVQNASNPDGFFYRPGVDAPRLPDVLTRAQRSFFSAGLRAPWYPALGNHDILVQGELPPSERTDAIATGREALLTFDPALETLLDRLPTGNRGDRRITADLRDVPPEAIDALLTDGVPGRTATVPADRRRRHLRPGEAVQRLRRGAGLPAGAAGAAGQRLDYAVDIAPALRAIVLDTVDRAGGGAVVTPENLAFLRRELGRAGDRAIVVVDHYGLHRTRGGAAAQAILARDDRVIAELTGDTHRHEIEPVRTGAGGYWRITTASLADWPQQGRMLRLVTGPDGARSLETWTVDHAGGLDTDDLAGAARQLAYLDAQGGRPAGFAGARTDRNARLWLPPRR
jgi:hypothetical protein